MSAPFLIRVASPASAPVSGSVMPTLMVLSAAPDGAAARVAAAATEPARRKARDQADIVAARMSEHQLKQLPVLGPDGALLGIVTRAAIERALAGASGT